MKKVLVCILIIAMTFTMFACGGDVDAKIDAPKGAPYEGLYLMNHLNYSFSMTTTPKKVDISLTLNWKTDEAVTAAFTDEYYLEWSMMQGGPYEIVDPNTTTEMTKAGKYELKPNEKLKFNVDIDSYFEGLPRGYYRIVKIFEVKQTDGTKEKRVAAFDFNVGMDDD